MKESWYNVFVMVPEEHKVIAANLYTGSMLAISPSLYEEFKAIAKRARFSLDDLPNSDFAQQLVEGGFVVEDRYDEILQLRVRNRIERFNQSILELTILPTLDCNAACSYCFIHKSRKSMTKEVQEAILALIAGVLPQKEGLRICWMGGEPLLEKPTIVDLSRSMLSICSHMNKTFEANIITNGILLTKNTAQELIECGVTQAQVTLDGPKRFHDKLRITRGGRGTWDRIIRNIKDSSELIEIKIRVHVTRENSFHMEELFLALKNEGLDKKVTVYFDTLNAEGEGCKSFGYSQGNMLFTSADFAWVMVKLHRQMSEKGFKGDEIDLNKSCVCGAIALHSLLIEPDGKIQKCWLNIGLEEEAGGNIKDGYHLLPNIAKWLDWDAIYQGEECRNCKILPVCMGFCPYRHMNDYHETKCLPLRYNLEEYIKEVYFSN